MTQAIPVELGARFTPALSAGAGRSIDVQWPDPAFSNSIGIACRTRAGNTLNGAATTGGVGGTGYLVTGVLNGDEFAQIGSNQPTDFSAVSFAPVMNIHIRTTKGGDGIASDDSLGVYRVLARMKKFAGADPLTDGTHDYGFQIARTLGTTGFVLKDATDGWHIQFKNNTTVTFFVRGPNGGITQDIIVGDTTVMHTYEMRFFQSTKLAEAQFQLLIDSVAIPIPQATRFWGAGTNNPASALTGTLTGFRPQLVMFSGNVGGSALFVERLQMIAAQDLNNAF